MLSRNDVETAREQCKLRCQVAALEIIERELDRRGFYASDDPQTNEIHLQHCRAIPLLEDAARSGWYVTWVYRHDDKSGPDAPVKFIIADKPHKPPLGSGTSEVAAYSIEPVGSGFTSAGPVPSTYFKDRVRLSWV